MEQIHDKREPLEKKENNVFSRKEEDKFKQMSIGTPDKKIKTLSEDQKVEIKEIFDLFDTNKDNFLGFYEFRISMKALGFEKKKTEVLSLLMKHGEEDKRKIGRKEFYILMSEMIKERDPLVEMKKAFCLFDKNKKGRIGFHDLKEVADELGENVPEEELRAMIEEFDLDDDGYINEEEFLSIMTEGEF